MFSASSLGSSALASGGDDSSLASTDGVGSDAAFSKGDGKFSDQMQLLNSALGLLIPKL